MMQAPKPAGSALRKRRRRMRRQPARQPQAWRRRCGRGCGSRRGRWLFDRDRGRKMRLTRERVEQRRRQMAFGEAPDGLRVQPCRHPENDSNTSKIHGPREAPLGSALAPMEPNEGTEPKAGAVAAPFLSAWTFVSGADGAAILAPRESAGRFQAPPWIDSASLDPFRGISRSRARAERYRRLDLLRQRGDSRICFSATATALSA